MKNQFMWLAVGFVTGICVGYAREEELDDIYRKTKKTKRKMMKTMQHACDDACDCLHLD